MFLYERKDWPNFTWNQEKLLLILSEIRHRQGRLIGKIEGLGFVLREEALLQTLTLEVIKTSEIEGEILDPEQVRSSVARRLGMDIAGLIPADRHVDGVVEMMLDAIQQFLQPLTDDRLFGWHAGLFPSGRSGMHKIVTGAYRDNTPDDPMQVVSGPLGKEKVHFTAPKSDNLSKEMRAFRDWFNRKTDLHPVIKSAVAHLWFMTIHPFDDGNGRIGRTIADMQLARADGIPQRFYSMSAQIRVQRNAYYDILEKTQKGNLDITAWLEWFLRCLDAAVKAAEQTLSNVLKKARYWELFALKTLTERQKMMVNKLLNGFDGKLTTAKWAKMAKCSHDTALRDIADLIRQQVLEKEQGGSKNTSYKLVEVN